MNVSKSALAKVFLCARPQSSSLIRMPKSENIPGKICARLRSDWFSDETINASDCCIVVREKTSKSSVSFPVEENVGMIRKALNTRR